MNKTSGQTWGKKNQTTYNLKWRKYLALTQTQTGHRHRPFIHWNPVWKATRATAYICCRASTHGHGHADPRSALYDKIGMQQEGRKDPRPGPCKFFQSCLAWLPSPQEYLMRWSLVWFLFLSSSRQQLIIKLQREPNFLGVHRRQQSGPSILTGSY